MTAAYTHFLDLAKEVQPPDKGILSRTLFNDDRLKAVLYNCAVRGPAARGRGRREPDPGGHAVPALAQQRGVPVRLVEVPGGADHHVTPSGRAVERAEAAVEALGGRARRDVRDAPVGAAASSPRPMRTRCSVPSAP